MKRFLISVGLLFLLVAVSKEAMALGIGVYFNGGGGKTNWRTDNIVKNENFIGGGFMLDTCVAREGIFNYRLQMGYDHNIPARYTKLFTKYESDFYRINMINTFGFGIIRHEIVRFWLGPQVLLRYENSYMREKDRLLMLLFRPIFPFVNPFGLQQPRQHLGQFDIGAVLGLNIHLGKLVSLTVDGGIRYGGLLHSIRSNPIWEGFANVGILFRFNDVYAEEKKYKIDVDEVKK